MDEMKPGIKTTEFWLAVLVTSLGLIGPTLLSIYPANNLPEWGRITSILAGAILSGLATLGYTRGRAAVKATMMENQARMEEQQMKATGEGGFARLGVMFTTVVLAFFMTTALGCGVFDMKKYDPETSLQIDKTIAHEKANQLMIAMPTPGLSWEQLALEYKVLSDAEVARLEAWKAAEEAKKLEDTPPTEGQ